MPILVFVAAASQPHTISSLHYIRGGGGGKKLETALISHKGTSALRTAAQVVVAPANLQAHHHRSLIQC
jgi:hypothetical protein